MKLRRLAHRLAIITAGAVMLLLTYGTLLAIATNGTRPPASHLSVLGIASVVFILLGLVPGDTPKPPPVVDQGVMS